MTINIRQMKDTDIDEVYAIETSVHISPWSQSLLINCILVGYDCRILEINEAIVGYIISRYSNNQCHIINLSIAKLQQSQGYGRRLLESFLSSLPTHVSIDSVILEVRSSNTIAIELYKSLGFEQMEIKESYYKDAKGFEDAIVLKKPI